MLLRSHAGIIQQDNYIEYAQAIPNKLEGLSHSDTRLFPGLPVFIFVLNSIINNWYLSGYLIVFISFVGSYVLLYKLSGSKYSFLPLVFPPIILNQTTKIATEPLTIFFLLLSIYLLQKKRYMLVSFLIGISAWVRLIGSIPLLALLIHHYKRKKTKPILVSIVYFLLPMAVFAFFNTSFFGVNDILHPFAVYKQEEGFNLGIIQLFKDLPRAYAWGWYRTFFSGIAYLVFFLYLLISSYLSFRKRPTEFKTSVFTIIIFLTLFIFSWSSHPFLESMARYLSPVFPLMWLLVYKKFANPILAYALLLLSIGVVLI